MKKNAYFIYPLIFFLAFLILNKISKNYLENTKWEKTGRKDFVEKVYGKENVDDYLTVLEEQTVSFKYKPFVEIVENQRKGKFISVGVKGNRCNKNNIRIIKNINFITTIKFRDTPRHINNIRI